MALSPTMRTFGSCINDEFGDVIETGLMITIKDIFEEIYEKEYKELSKKGIDIINIFNHCFSVGLVR